MNFGSLIASHKAHYDFFSDNFIDDASSRRLGNGASFYGKRKSGFYGPDDEFKKSVSSVADSSEDYQGPTGGGYFVWRKTSEGRAQP